MTSKKLAPLRVVAIALFVFALARGLSFVLHAPLLGLANNYDQIRYSICIGVAPYRPGVQADQNNPKAPLRLYSFQDLPHDVCNWTSDLLLTAPLSLGWHLAEYYGAPSVHSIRKLGVLRVLIWCAAGLWAALAWLRAGSPIAALANLAGLGFIVFDPGNAIYFNTFYAQPAALFGLYLCLTGACLALMQQGGRGAYLVALMGACILATSKFQHVVLPALLGAGALAAGWKNTRLVAFLFVVGSAFGLTAAMMNRLQSAETLNAVATANRADVVLSALLLNVDEPAAVARQLGLTEQCASYANPGGIFHARPIEKTCPGILTLSDTRARLALIERPTALFRAVSHGFATLLPWIPEYLGLVEGEDFGKLPASQPTLSSILGTSKSMAYFLLSLPWLILAAACHLRAAPAARAFFSMCACASIGVPFIALLGDGYLDFQKHSHLATNCVLASLCVALAWLASQLLRARREPRADAAPLDHTAIRADRSA